jgi:opacity protein-like surface antigen
MKPCILVALAGLLTCGSASAQALDYKQKAKKPAPRDPAATWPHRWYLGASLQQNETSDWSVSRQTDDGSFQSVDADDQDFGHSLYGGVSFERTFSFALELGYLDFGGTSQTIQSDGSGIVWAAGPIRERQQLKGALFSMLAGRPVGHGVSLFLRLGALKWTSEFAYTGTTQGSGPVRNSGRHNHVDAVFGGGVAFDATDAWRLRAAYMSYPLSDSELNTFEPTVDALEVSVAYRFGKGPGG